MAMSAEDFDNVINGLNTGGSNMDSLIDEKYSKILNASQNKQAKLGVPISKSHAIAGEGLHLQGNDLGGGYSVVNGKKVFNHNKIINNMNQDQMGQYMSDVYDQTIQTDKQGNDFQYGDFNTETNQWNKKYLEDQDAKEGYLYGGRGKTDEDLIKFGYSAFGGQERYTPGMAKDADGNMIMTGKRGHKTPYGWKSGEQGIDTAQMIMNWRLPEQVAKDAEGVIHGNEGMIGRRDMFDDGSKESIARRQELGSGASEYYNDVEGKSIFGGANNGFVPTGDEAARDKVAGTRDVNGLITVDDITDARNAKVDLTDENVRKDWIREQLSKGREEEDGRALSNVKGAVVGLAKMFGQVADAVAEGVADVEEKYLDDTIWSEAMGRGAKERNKLRDLFNEDQAEYDKAFGGSMKVNTKYQDMANKALDDEVQKYDGTNLASVIANTAGAVAKYTDVHLAQSTPEMVGLVAGIPGLLFTSMARTNKQIDEYKKNNNGKDMNEARKLEIFIANAGALGLEKFLVFKPLKRIMNGLASKVGLRAAEKGASRTLTQIGTGVAGSIAGEATQEIIDQQVEKWATKGQGYNILDKKTQLTAEEMIASGVAGGAISGVLTGGPAALESVGAAKRANDERRNRNREIDSGKYSTDADAEFIRAELGAKRAMPEDLKFDSEKAREELININSVEDLKNSKVKTLREFGEDLINQSNKEVTLGSTEHKSAIKYEINDLVKRNPAFAKNVDNKYGTNFEGKSKEEIGSIIDNLDIETIKRMSEENSDMFGIEEAKKTNSIKTLNDKFDVFKSNVEKTLDSRIEIANTQLGAHQTTVDRFEEGVQNRGGSKRNDSVNIKKIEEPPKGSISNSLLSVIGLAKTPKEKALKKLDQYTDEALDKAYEKGNDKVKSYIEQVQQARQDKTSGQNKGTIDVNKLAEESSIETVKEKGKASADAISGFFSKKDTPVEMELNKYSNEALDIAETEIDSKLNAITDKSKRKGLNSLKKNINALKKKRVSAKKQSGLDVDSDKQIRNLRFPKGDRKLTLNHLTDALVQREMNDLRDVRATEELINSAHEQKFLTDDQAKKYKDRLDKISQKATEPTKDVLAEEKKALEEHQNETGKSDVEMANTTKNEITEKDIAANNKEIDKDLEKVSEELEVFSEETKDIEEKDFTEDQKKEAENIKDKIEKIMNRKNENLRKQYQFTEAEADMNNDYGRLDEYFEGSEVFDLEKAFSPEEKAILNIC